MLKFGHCPEGGGGGSRLAQIAWSIFFIGGGGIV